MNRATRPFDWFVLALAIVLSVGSIGLFAWEGRPVFFPLQFPERTALAWDALLSFLFFLQHSGMVRRSFRTRLSAVVAARYHGAVYAIASGVALTLVAVLWQPTTTRVLALHGLARLVASAAALLAVAAFAYTVWVLRPSDPLGLGAIWSNLRHDTAQPSSFVVRGPYRWVRHPVYSSVLVMLWSQPAPTSDRLLLNLLWSGWICVGTTLEERDLVAEFGEVYRHYQQRVPMLIPWRRPVECSPAEDVR